MNGIGLAGLGVAGLMLLGTAMLAWRHRRRRVRIETAEDAAQAADATLAGFATAGAVVGADGVAALAVDGHGRVALCERQSGGIAVREVAWTAIRATAAGMVIDPERGGDPVLLAGVDALDVRRLAPQLTRAEG